MFQRANAWHASQRRPVKTHVPMCRAGLLRSFSLFMQASMHCAAKAAHV